MEVLSEMESSGRIREIIEKEVESAVKEVVHDLFGSWSDFSKGLKSHLKENLQINFKELNLPTYNHLILDAIKSSLDDQITTNGINQIKDQIEGLLLGTKREYKLSELVQELKNEVENADELDYGDYHKMTLHVDEISHGYFHIGLDPKEDVNEYGCKYQILVNSDGNVLSVKIKDKDSFSTRNIDEFDVKAVLHGLHGLEKTLFKIYASGAKLIVDENECDVYVSNSEYD